ncbi:MAG: nuclear transport factor 2 family protein [Gammaproteobacteria bacterium]|nr:nuclear transport factor 2 family protein [Gammaproteobacteria bacterium]
MKTSKPRFKTPEEADAVFYEAFKHCDSEVMAALWADTNVVCVHPGAGALVNHDAIIRSWANIFSNNHRTEINHTVINRVVSNDLAVFVVAEEILDSGTVAAVVLATNVYSRFVSGWLMIGHHASLVQNSSQGKSLQ